MPMAGSVGTEEAEFVRKWIGVTGRWSWGDAEVEGTGSAGSGLLGGVSDAGSFDVGAAVSV
ncbi:hypothetical protein C1J01_45925 [Nonomuraea aridisoli]|uniref:Uncharacterized protein n=1 Tax=Nonomuraea aridisoli TaxID=2070368 RepID=A0A2W2DHT0_9ACTN|nr:hypothetical protein C1J01_45925 [Nonomuraea aridisoli]